MRPSVKRVTTLAAMGIVLIVAAGLVRFGQRSLDTERTSKGPSKSPDAPTFYVADTEIDLGRVPTDRPTEHDIGIFNQGGSMLELTQVSSTCGCFSAKLADERVPPGGRTVLRLTVDPAGIRGFKTRQLLRIRSNDPANPSQVIWVTVGVDPEFLVEPEELDFGMVSVSDGVEGTVLIRQLREENVEVTELTQVGATKTLDLSFVRRPPEEWLRPDRPEFLIHVALAKDIPPGTFRAKFEIHTTCSRLPKLRYPVRALVQGRNGAVPVRPESRDAPGGRPL